MKNILLVMFAVICLGLSGCTHVTPVVSSMNFSPDAMEYLGTGTAESKRGYFLCVIPISGNNDPLDTRYSIGDAIDDAVKSKKGDALINTVAEHEWWWIFPPFWCQKTIRVHGAVVKFKKTENAGANFPGYQ